MITVISYKSNKIVLGLLVISSVISVRVGAMDPNGDPGQGPSSNVSTPEILVTYMSGNPIITFPKTTLSAARELTREALANQRKTDVWLEFNHNGQRIIDEEQFTHVTDGIQCVLVCLSEKAKFDAEDSFTRYTKEPIPILIIDRETKVLRKTLQNLFDHYGKRMNQPDFDMYKTTLLKRYAELICDKIMTIEDITLSKLIDMLHDLKEKYAINFAIDIGTDPSVTSAALEQFKTMVRQAFTSVKDDDSLETEMTKVKNFLDEHKGVLSHKTTDKVIRKQYRSIGRSPEFQMKFYNKVSPLASLYTKLLK